MNHVFFTDRDLGKRFPEILRAAGRRVERHADHFTHDAADEEWLETVGRQGWTAVTHDSRIRYKPNELAAVLAHRVALLIVVGKAPLGTLAESFVITLPRIDTFLGHTRLRSSQRSIGVTLLQTPQPSAVWICGTRRDSTLEHSVLNTPCLCVFVAFIGAWCGRACPGRRLDQRGIPAARGIFRA